ncbi:hypothetical protein CYMTET_22381, partial [Cymbomonas tetramitiformis]
MGQLLSVPELKGHIDELLAPAGYSFSYALSRKGLESGSSYAYCEPHGGASVGGIAGPLPAIVVQVILPEEVPEGSSLPATIEKESTFPPGKPTEEPPAPDSGGDVTLAQFLEELTADCIPLHDHRGSPSAPPSVTGRGTFYQKVEGTTEDALPVAPAPMVKAPRYSPRSHKSAAGRPLSLTPASNGGAALQADAEADPEEGECAAAEERIAVQELAKWLLAEVAGVSVESSTDPEQVTRIVHKAGSLMSGAHSNLVPVAGAVRSNEGILYVVYPAVASNLRSVMSFSPDALGGEQGILVLAYQLLSALDSLHSKRVVHGDLRADNVLLTEGMWLWLSGVRGVSFSHVPEEPCITKVDSPWLPVSSTMTDRHSGSKADISVYASDPPMSPKIRSNSLKRNSSFSLSRDERGGYRQVAPGPSSSKEDLKVEAEGDDLNNLALDFFAGFFGAGTEGETNPPGERREAPRPVEGRPSLRREGSIHNGENLRKVAAGISSANAARSKATEAKAPLEWLHDMNVRNPCIPLALTTGAGRSDKVATWIRAGLTAHFCMQGACFKTLEALVSSWRWGQISNLEYLLALNRMAGRLDGNRAFCTVLPWVLDMTQAPEDTMNVCFPNVDMDA